jgi:hypothetical protein
LKNNLIAIGGGNDVLILNLEGMSSSDELDIFSPGEMQENTSKTVSVRWN